MSKEIEEMRLHKKRVQEIKTYTDALAERLKLDGYTFTIALERNGIAATRWWGKSHAMCAILGNMVQQVAGSFAEDALQFAKQLRDMGVDIDKYTIEEPKE